MPSRRRKWSRRKPWEDPLAIAFMVSAALHSLIFGGILILPGWAALVGRTLSEAELAAMQKAREEQRQKAEREVPLLFVEVNPAIATQDAPEDAKFYSDKSSRAANPDENLDTDAPRITGTQTQVAKTEDTPRSKAVPLQPSLPAPPEQQTPVPVESRPKGGETPGDLALARPSDKTGPDKDSEKDAPTIGRPKPRTLAEARQQLGLSGEKMRQDGGVRRQALSASFNVKATPFGAYDAAIIAAIQSRWYALLDSRDLAYDRSGKVVLEFRLNYDGRITDMKVTENTVDALLSLLCQKAVLDPAPYNPWPSDMRRLVGADYREVRFTFYYN